jgi:hypothetical protein
MVQPRGGRCGDATRPESGGDVTLAVRQARTWTAGRYSTLMMDVGTLMRMTGMRSARERGKEDGYQEGVEVGIEVEVKWK